MIINMPEAAVGSRVWGKKATDKREGKMYSYKDEENICAVWELKKFPEEILLSFLCPPFTMD